MQEFAIKQIYSNKIKEYKKNNKFYYDENKPKISDFEFDNLKN